MKIMFIAYHDIQTEARTQEVLQCAQSLGEAYFVSFSKPIEQKNCVSLLTGNGIRNYRTFVFDAIKYIKKINPDVIILHDNYTAIILRWILFNRDRPFLIYDSSELYIDLKPKSAKDHIAKLMQHLEQKYIKFADVIIAANIERAKIMKEYYKLETTPLVFDNIHRIDDTYNVIKCESKYGELFGKATFVAVYAGGISKGRMTYELADAVGKLGKDFSLIIIGSAKEEEKINFEKYIQKNSYNNVSYLGFISRSEFRYLLNRAHVSISAFSQDTVNNKYCASGKVYESLFEGKPILTTENPPFKRLCEDHGVGVSTNNFFNGLNQLKTNYKVYCQNVENYVSQIDYHGRIKKLSDELQNEINIHSKGLIK